MSLFVCAHKKMMAHTDSTDGTDFYCEHALGTCDAFTKGLYARLKESH
jgi:hypothetical protein